MKKRLLCLILALVTACTVSGVAVAIDTSDVDVVSFDENVDYTAKMLKCLEDGSEYALYCGAIFERQRNLKIETLGMEYEMSYYFQDYNTAEEIEAAMNADKTPAEPEATPQPTPEPTPTPEPAPSYTDDDLYWLSHVVFAEAGCDWFPDWVQQATASVVLNRVSDPRYPDTIKDVIFDPGQYSCVDNGSIYGEPTQKVINNCKYVLENGSTLPSYVIGQSSYAWGPVYTSYYDSILGTTIKFFSV